MKKTKIEIIGRCGDILSERGRRYYLLTGRENGSYNDVAKLFYKSIECLDKATIYHVIFRHLLLEKAQKQEIEIKCILSDCDMLKIEEFVNRRKE